MAYYYIKAMTITGKKISRIYKFNDELSLYEFCARKDIIVDFTFKLPKVYNFYKKIFNKVKKDDVAELLINIRAIHNSGMSIGDSLEDLVINTDNNTLANALLDMSIRMRNGKSLSSVMKAYPNIFENVTIAFVSIGEETGELSNLLSHAVSNIRRISELKKQTISALRLPLFVLSIIVFYLILRIGVLLSFAIFVIMYLLNKFIFKKSIEFQYNKDKMILKIPVIGKLVNSFNTVFFFVGLKAMLSTGISLYRTLDIMAESMDNNVYKHAISQVSYNVEQGKSLAHSMSRTRLFSSYAIRMITAGERAGRLDEQIDDIAMYYNNSINHTIENLPILLKIFGTLFIGMFIIRAVFFMFGGLY